MSAGFASAGGCRLSETGAIDSRELQPEFDAVAESPKILRLELSSGSIARSSAAESRLNGAMNRSLWVDSMTDRQNGDSDQLSFLSPDSAA